MKDNGRKILPLPCVLAFLGQIGALSKEKNKSSHFLILEQTDAVLC